jgi:cytochrome c
VIRALTFLASCCLVFGAQVFAQDKEDDASAHREPGLSARFYFIGEPMEKVLPLVPGQTPNVARILPTLDLKDQKIGDFDETFLAHVQGWLETEAAGKYEFKLSSDDGSILRIDGNVAIDHDGLHSPSGRIAALDLKAGLHPIDIWFFQGYGGWELRLEWKKPGASKFEVVPESALSCHAGEVRVTAPGPKKVIKPLEKGRPGDGMPVDTLNPSLDVMTIRPDDFHPRVGGIAWLPDGRMAITTWDEIGAVYFIDGVHGDDRSKIKMTRFAAGLAEPLGIQIVDGRVFVLQKQELSELVDTDHDGVADEYRCISNAWDVSANFHEFAFGLVHKDGWLYFNLAIAINPGGKSTQPQVPGRGSALRVKIADGTTEVVAHGLRTPNGIGLGPQGEIFLTDNQGDWLPSSKLLHLEKGAFYGSRAVLLDQAKDLPVTPPVLWMPQNEIGNSPSNPTLIPAGWGPFSGQMCHGDVTHGGVKRDFLEVVDGVWQGCILDWTQGLEAGVNRISFGPDGALYIGGIGSTGNWGQEGKLRYGLQRVKYNGKSSFEILAARAKSNGFEVEFTEPLQAGAGWDPENWRVEQWRYVPTTDYGGPKIDQETLKVRAASISSDRKRAFLEIEGLKEGRVVYIHVVGPVVNEKGATLFSTQAWYTLNKLSKDAGTTLAPPAPAPQNVLTDAERAQGWDLLFDGKSTARWHGYKQTGPAKGWSAKDGALVRGDGGGDLASDVDYQDFELVLEWKIEKGSNSGVFFHVTEDHGYPWETGPEMQILDNDEHPDGKNPLTSAGANYALQAPDRDYTRPIGMWNQVRMLVKGTHVEYWLNGSKTADYELWNDAWKSAVKASKFASMPDYGLRKTGRIVLQDHGDFVAFRNVKVRKL